MARRAMAHLDSDKTTPKAAEILPAAKTKTSYKTLKAAVVVCIKVTVRGY